MIKIFKFLFLFFIFPSVGFTNTDDCQKLLNFSQKYDESIKGDIFDELSNLGDELNAWGITFKDYLDYQDYLDENYKSTYARTEDNYILISKIHPKLSFIYKSINYHDEEINLLASDYSYIRKNNIVKKINGKKVDELNDEEIKNEMDNFSTLTFLDADGSEGSIDTEHINKHIESEWSETNLLSFVKPRAIIFSTSFKINSIRKIDSKHSESQSVIVLNSVYEEKELASFIAKNYSKPIECSTDIKTANSMDFLTNVYSPVNFVPTSNSKSEVTISFLPASFHKSLGEGIDDAETSYEPTLEIEEETTFIGKFMHKFDLKKFPFDRQYLDFSFRPKDAHLALLITHDFLDAQDEAAIKTNAYDLVLPEWDILDASKVYGDYYSEDIGIYMPSKGIRIEVERKKEYYIYKVFFPIFIILAISWSIFWIRIEELESRVTISIVCMLSLIAYNFVIDDSLPKLGILTLIDMLVILSYVFSAIPTLESVIVNNLHRNKREELSIIFDEKCRYLVPSAFFVLSFLILVLYLYS